MSDLIVTPQTDTTTDGSSTTTTTDGGSGTTSTGGGTVNVHTRVYDRGNDVELTFSNPISSLTFTQSDTVDVSNIHTDITSTDINDSFYGNYDDVLNPYTTKYIVKSEYIGTTQWVIRDKTFTESVYRNTKDYSNAHYEFDDALDDAKSIYTRDKTNSTIEFNSDDDSDESSSSISSTSDEWEVDFEFLSPLPGEDYTDIITTVKQSEVILNTTEDMNEWMPGGTLYNDSFAGNDGFNVTGTISQERFLGIENNNIDYMYLAKNGLIGEPYKDLHITAGSRTDGNDADIYTIIFNKKLRDASGDNFIVEESTYTGTLGDKTVTRDNTINTWVEFRDNITDTLFHWSW